MLHRISNESDETGICTSSSGAIVGSGLLVAVYVEPLAAGQADADGSSVASVDGEVAGVGPNWVTVIDSALLVSVTAGVGVSLFLLFLLAVIGASLCRSKVSLFCLFVCLFVCLFAFECPHDRVRGRS